MIKGMSKEYRDKIAMICHDIMKDAHNAGGVSDTEMKEFEADYFGQDPETPFETENSLTHK